MNASPIDPYEPPAALLAHNVTTTNDRDRLLKAFLIAPLAGPLVLSVVTVLGGLIMLQLRPETVSTPVGLILIPLLMMTVGVVVAYCDALAVGLPVILLLRRYGWLNGWAIHLTGILCAAIPAIIFALIEFFTEDSAFSWAQRLRGLVFLIAYLSIGGLASGTTFWWLTRSVPAENA